MVRFLLVCIFPVFIICNIFLFCAPVVSFNDVYKQNKIQLITPSVNLQNPWNDSSVWGNFNTLSSSIVKKKNINPWTGTSFYFGYAGTKGDSNNTNITLGGNFRYLFNEKLFNVLKVNYIFNSNSTSGVTANNYNILNYLIYTFDSYNGMYVMGSYFEDYFSGYDYTAAESIGYRRIIFNDKVQTMSALIGPAGVQRVAPSPPTPEAPSYYYLAANSLVSYKYNITTTSNFSENFGIIVGAEQTMSQSVTAITTQINEHLSMQLNYAWIYNTAPALGKCRSNTQTTMALIYGI